MQVTNEPLSVIDSPGMDQEGSRTLMQSDNGLLIGGIERMTCPSNIQFLNENVVYKHGSPNMN